MNKWTAVRYMVISTLAFTMLNAIVKYLDSFPAHELVFFRSLGSSAMCFAYLLKNRIPILGNERKWLVLRAVVGTIAISFFFLAIQHLPFGPVVALRYLSPVFAAIFAVLLLKEKVRPIQVLFFAMAIGGVGLIKGFTLDVAGIGLVYILIAAVFGGLVYVIIRRIGRQDHPLVIVNYFMFTSTLVGGAFCLYSWKVPHGIEWAILGSMSLLGFFAQLFMTKALQIAPASRVAPVKFLEVIYSIIIGFVWFGDSYSLLGLAGIGLIMTGMYLNVKVKGG